DSGDLDGAARALADVPATSSEGHLLRGLVALAVDGTAAALIHLGRAVADEPGYLQAQLALARALDRAGRLDAAEVAARRAVGLDPRCPEAHLRLGAILARRGEGQISALAYRRAEALYGARRLALAQRDRARTPPGEPAQTRAGPRRIAVLHFANARSEPAWEWLGVGIAEALSMDLSLLSRLEVIDPAL